MANHKLAQVRPPRELKHCSRGSSRGPQSGDGSRERAAWGKVPADPAKLRLDESNGSGFTS